MLCFKKSTCCNTQSIFRAMRQYLNSNNYFYFLSSTVGVIIQNQAFMVRYST